MTDERIMKLEMHLAEQQQMLDDLSDVIASQGQQINRLKHSLALSDTRISELETGLPAPVVEKPPHY